MAISRREIAISRRDWGNLARAARAPGAGERGAVGEPHAAETRGRAPRGAASVWIWSLGGMETALSVWTLVGGAVCCACARCAVKESNQHNYPKESAAGTFIDFKTD